MRTDTLFWDWLICILALVLIGLAIRYAQGGVLHSQTYECAVIGPDGWAAYYPTGKQVIVECSVTWREMPRVGVTCRTIQEGGPILGKTVRLAARCMGRAVDYVDLWDGSTDSTGARRGTRVYLPAELRQAVYKGGAMYVATGLCWQAGRILADEVGDATSL